MFVLGLITGVVIGALAVCGLVWWAINKPDGDREAES